MGELSESANNKIGQKQIPVTISCTAPTKLGFTITDNRGDSNAQLPVDIAGNLNQTTKYYTYGVGKTAQGVKIGNYGMWMTGVSVDGKAADSIGNNHDWASTKWKKRASLAAMRSRLSRLPKRARLPQWRLRM